MYRKDSRMGDKSHAESWAHACRQARKMQWNGNLPDAISRWQIPSPQESQFHKSIVGKNVRWKSGLSLKWFRHRRHIDVFPKISEILGPMHPLLDQMASLIRGVACSETWETLGSISKQHPAAFRYLRPQPSRREQVFIQPGLYSALPCLTGWSVWTCL